VNTARHQPPSDPTSPSRRWVFPALAAALVALGLGPPSSAASPPEAVSAWAILRTLAGPEGVATWDADLDGDGAPDTAVTYRLIGGGTALVETLFPGTGHEMETIHHLDRRGDDTRLLCTHYCGAGNQPRLVLTGGDLAPENGSPPTLVYTFLDATNLPDPDAVHMNGVTFTFRRPDRVDAAWTVSNEGVTGPHATFAMTRRAAAGSDEPSNEEPAMTTTDAKSGTAPSDDAAIESLPTFAILMLEDDDAWATLPPSERDALLAKYGAFVQELAAQGRFVWGTPLGRETVLLAGPPGSTSRSEIAPRKGVLTGIFVIRAKDLAEAESIARECPALLHGERVLVRPASH
jgi:hypothetical protein